jgi:hypothetical protein
MSSSSQTVKPTTTKHSNHRGMKRDTSPKQTVAFQRMAEPLDFDLMTNRKESKLYTKAPESNATK